MIQPDPLTPEQKEELAGAGRRAATILKAGRVAAFNGWTLLVFGALSVLFGLFSPVGMAVGVLLLALGWNELRGRGLLRALDPRGARILGWNQISLMGVITAYCLWSLHRTLAHPDPEMVQLEEMVGISREMVTQVTVLAYGGVILLTAVFQGLLSRYHFARERLLAEYLEQTPGWILELQRGISSP